jgi:hypothetical protein
MMNASGDVIMSDDKIIARINYPYPAAGGSLWATSLPASPTATTGPTFSPNLIDYGMVAVIATGDPGIISAYWADNGS